jgi:G3E family GTPase
MRNEDLQSARKIPVTILTGFLGAGKTTLLQRLVRECVGKKIVVIQNEVSEEMGIESAVLTDSNGKIIPDFFELPNGCICCTSKDDMVTVLENIVNLGRDRVDAVVVETTGVADPCSVAEIFWVDDALGSCIYLDGIVTVVDSVNFASVFSDGHYLDHSDIARRQIAIADRIILNKCDLASENQVAGTRATVLALNPTADVVATSNSTVDPDWVLSIGSLSNKKLGMDLHHHTSLATVDHVLLSLDGTFDIHTLESVIGVILWESTCGSVYRVKGLVTGADGSWFSIQGVGAMFEILSLPASAVAQLEQPVQQKILFIGSQLARGQLESSLEAAGRSTS